MERLIYDSVFEIRGIIFSVVRIFSSDWSIGNISTGLKRIISPEKIFG